MVTISMGSSLKVGIAAGVLEEVTAYVWEVVSTTRRRCKSNLRGKLLAVSNKARAVL